MAAAHDSFRNNRPHSLMRFQNGKRRGRGKRHGYLRPCGPDRRYGKRWLWLRQKLDRHAARLLHTARRAHSVRRLPHAQTRMDKGRRSAAGAVRDDFRTVGGEYYSVSEDDYEKNCEEARQILADAGYPDGEGFPTVEYLYNTDDKHKKIAEALQNMWQKELGVTVNLDNQDWNVFLQNRKDGNFQIARNGWIADYNDPCSFLDMWYTDGGNNDAQYSNPDYDAAIDAAKATSDQAERMKAFHEAEDILIGQDSVLAPIYFYTQPYMLNPDIDGMYYTPLGYFFFGYTSKK